MDTTKKTLGGKLSSITVCLLTMLTGILLIIDPHFNVYGYAEMHSLARMLGWILMTIGLKLLTKITSKPWSRKANIIYLDFSVLGFIALTLISSLCALVLQRSIGLTNTVAIQDSLFWYLEIAYAFLAGVIGILYYRKRQSIIQLMFGTETL